MTVSLLSTSSRYFLEVARTGSVTLAASQLHVAVSAVSRQITKLEASLGCTLFERQARGMTLSPAGERLAAYVRSTQLDAENVVDEVKGLGGQSASRIRVACTEGLACGFMATVMSSFKQLHPQCSIFLQVLTPEGVSRLLLRGETDIGIKFSITPEKGLKLEHKQNASILALLSPHHVLAQSRSLSITEIVHHPLALPDTESTVRQMLDLCCSLHGVHYETAYEGNFATLLELTKRGGVLTFSSMVSAYQAVRTGELVAIPVTEQQFRQRSLQVLSLEGQKLNQLASGFMVHLIELMRLHGQEISAD